MDPVKIRDVKVWGTVMEGRKLATADAAKNGMDKALLGPNDDGEREKFSYAALYHAVKVATCIRSSGGPEWPRVTRQF